MGEAEKEFAICLASVKHIGWLETLGGKRGGINGKIDKIICQGHQRD